MSWKRGIRVRDHQKESEEHRRATEETLPEGRWSPPLVVPTPPQAPREEPGPEPGQRSPLRLCPSHSLSS